MRIPALLLTLVFAVTLTTSAADAVRAQVLEAPAAIVADADGTFSYTAAFTYPPQGAKFGAVTIEGVENVAYGWVGDGFCMQFVAGGTVDSLRVEAALTNPGAPGAVVVTFDICSPDAHETATTMILPHVVPLAPARWSALKADYGER